MDRAAFQRATDLGVCLRCLCLFINGKNDSIITKTDDEVVSYVAAHVQLGEYRGDNSDAVCPCCVGFLQKKRMADVIAKATEILQVEAGGQAELYEKLFAKQTQHVLNIAPSLEEAQLKIEVDFTFQDETGLCLTVDPEFKPCRKRKLLGGVELRGKEHTFDVSRKDADRLVMAIRESEQSDRQYAQLSARLVSYFRTPLTCPTAPTPAADVTDVQQLPLVRWSLRMFRQPVYLLGRYCKYARDISQAPWTVGAGGGDGDDDAGQGSHDMRDGSGDMNVDADQWIGLVNKGQSGGDIVATAGRGPLQATKVRKGRSSVEEIICEAVTHYLQCRTCRMHPCGREDIDVRMLGNGRPFVLEVLEAKVPPCPDVLQQIIAFIEAGAGGMNTDRDVKCRCLKQVDRSVWTTMQAAAEEKNKAYICVCWSADKLSRDKLRQLEALPQLCGDRDSEGIPCLQITQKTPLRVLHRRPLLPRSKYIYSLDAVQLNDHNFLLSVVTSAGTYVKEFVHGDLGRTQPSVSSILQINADIMQLDVVWLFDSFAGNDCEDADLTEDKVIRSVASSRGSGGAGGDEPVVAPNRVTWNELKGKRIATNTR